MRYMYFFTDGNVKSMHLPTCSQQTGLELTIPYLRCDVSDSTWSMRDEDRRGLGWGPNLLHGVEVLGHQNHVHDILWRGPRNIPRESKNTLSQPIHYSLALSCDTQTRQVLGFCITFSSLDLQYLLCLSFLSGSQPQPSSCFINRQEQFRNTGTEIHHTQCFVKIKPYNLSSKMYLS